VGSKAHNAPFDRLLIAQAKVENLSLLTHDELIPDYGEKCIIPV
jgi:PIN domain nuclease of toxin-antitoxin system